MSERTIPHRILITGSREWTDRDTISQALADLWREWGQPTDAILVHGACPSGADLIAHEIWTARGYPVETHPADWKAYGRAAGPKRNKDMVVLGADMCLAFVRGGSRGAAGCVRLAEKAGIPVRRWDCDADGGPARLAHR
jgi:hypothetical protein